MAVRLVSRQTDGNLTGCLIGLWNLNRFGGPGFRRRGSLTVAGGRLTDVFLAVVAFLAGAFAGARRTVDFADFFAITSSIAAL
jgi:hypothetical protein